MKGHALLIGVDYLDKSHYLINRRTYSLKIQENFDRITKVLNKTNSYSSINYIGGNSAKDATWENVLKGISDYQKQLTNNEFLTIYLLCHSTLLQIPGQGESEFICLKNRLVYLKQWQEELTKIDPLFNVFIVSDSCYSGSLYKFDKGEMQNTFDYHYKNTYKDVVDRSYTQNYKANFFFLNSSEPKKSSKENYFTERLVALWENGSASTNYFEFAEMLTKNMVPTPSYWFKNNGSINNFFKDNTLFHSSNPPIKSTDDKFDSKSNKILADLAIIQTDEVENHIVGVRLNEPNPFYYVDTYSWSFEIDHANPTFQALVNKLIAIDRSILVGIDVIGVVYVNFDGETGTEMPLNDDEIDFVPIRYLKSVETNIPANTGNGLIVIEAVDSAGLIVGKKRTQGKVTNKQGGE